MRILLDQDTSKLPEVWQAVCRLLEESLTPKQVMIWIQPLSFLGLESTGGGVALAQLRAQNDFIAHWVRDHFQRKLEEAFSTVIGAPCRVALDVATEASPSTFEPAVAHRSGESPDPQLQQPEFEAISGQNREHQPPLSSPVGRPSPTRPSAAPRQESGLDPRYTFESFVVGASNQFAHAFAVSVAEQPAKQFNPLLIHSRPGLGKTHLLHAIGNHFLLKNPGARVLYVSAERFVNELVDVLVKRGDMSEFRKKYRDSFDMLLIDDVQFIASKEKSEEEFFHTFNALHNSKRQIVLTSDRSPKEIQGFGERVITRLEWGPVADIQPPEIETRIAILKTKAERDDIYMPDEVATFLATHIKSNVRELEGTLVKLQAYASLAGSEISLDLAKQQLRAVVPEETAQYTVDAIQGAVLKHFNLKAQDLKSNSRARRVALPRQIAMHLIRKYTTMSFVDIGHYFGGKDHSTIRHGCQKIDHAIETDADLRRQVEAVQNLL